MPIRLRASMTDARRSALRRAWQAGPGRLSHRRRSRPEDHARDRVGRDRCGRRRDRAGRALQRSAGRWSRHPARQRTRRGSRTRLEDVLALAAEIRSQRPQAGLVIFSYFNPVLRYGLERFCAAAEQAGVDGVLDHRHDRRRGRRISRDAATSSSGADLPRRSHQSRRAPASASPPRLQGFVYAISRMGITGAQQSLASDAEQLVARLRRFTQLPIAVGFGISPPSTLRRWASSRTRRSIGSAIVALIEQSSPAEAPDAIARFIKGLRHISCAEPVKSPICGILAVSYDSTPACRLACNSLR